MGRGSTLDNGFEAFPGLEGLLQEIEEDFDPSAQQKPKLPRQRGSSPKVVQLRVNDTVIVHGLKAAAELNGCLGTVEAWDSETSRWRVRIATTGEAKRIKGDNLTWRESPASAREPKARHRSKSRSKSQSRQEDPEARPRSHSKSRTKCEPEQACALRAGSLVKVVNLEAAAHLNGSEATCEDWDAHAKRWMVRFHRDGHLRRVRPENLELQAYVKLRVSGPAGMLVHLDVSTQWQVSQVKDAIERIRDDCPRIEQRLLIEGQELNDEEKIEDFVVVGLETEVLDLTLLRKPVFSVVDGNSSAASDERPDDHDANRKPELGMSTSWASIEGNLRAARAPGKVPYGYVNQQHLAMAGKGVGKGPGRLVATRHPELAVGMRHVR